MISLVVVVAVISFYLFYVHDIDGRIYFIAADLSADGMGHSRGFTASQAEVPAGLIWQVQWWCPPPVWKNVPSRHIRLIECR